MIVDRNFQKTVLPNGLRVISETIPSVRSISLGVWVEVGSRFEPVEFNGMSHFIEHMVFKGTKRRNAAQIASSLEEIGGNLNAFTSREHTCYTARVLDEFLPDALDVLADLTCHATFTPSNMNKERQVIGEEIKESLDNPSDHVHDLFAKAYWGDHPLGRPILGPKTNIDRITRQEMVSYVRNHYRAESIVVAASGSLTHKKLVSLVKEKFSFPDGRAPQAAAPKRSHPRSVEVTTNDNSQVHLTLAFPGLQYRSTDRIPALLLNAYLGGGMSSVLFQKIREDKGLAYSVYTYHDFLKDTGVFGAYVGTDKDHVVQALDILRKETARMKKKPLTPAQLSKIKAQIKGNLTLGLESTSSRMNRIARLELMLGSFQTIPQTLREIDRVTSKQIQELANRMFDDKQLAIAVLGPVQPSTFAHV